MNIDNPFVLEPYYSKEYFCDRVEETALLRELLLNRQNVTIISPRRYGKTGLIYRVFDELSDSSEYDCYYVDIYSASSLDDFIRLLSEAVVNVLKKDTLIDRFVNMLGAIRPVISFDVIAGKYSLTYSMQSVEQKQLTLKAILNFLENEQKTVILAIDEFQQIRDFEDVKMEALLRTYIQPLHNVRFIFCGSKKHMMINMFTDAMSPFYESTECVFLDRIEKQNYKDFMRRMFALGSITIDDDALEMIMQWTCGHTYYVQYLCNRLYALHVPHIDCALLNQTIYRILKQRENSYLERRNLLTKNQWNFLKAIACEGILTKPTSSSFLNRYSLGAPSTAKKTLQSLIDKELVLETTTIDGNSYRVYNVFFMRWLAM